MSCIKIPFEEMISDIVLRMCDAYGVQSEKDLAENLNIGKNTISRWKVRKNIPDKYLLRAAKETGRPLTWFLEQENPTPPSLTVQSATYMEEIIASGNYNFTPETRGEIIAFLVEEFNRIGEVSKERIQEIIDLTVLVQRKL